MVLLLAMGCLLVSKGEQEVLLDPDEDGVPWPEDCDGSKSTIFPGATEICDGLDQDCDGEIDEEPSDGSTFYADADGDAYGDAETTTVACEDPGEGWTADSSDCYDTEATVYPGALTICGDRLVNDCDADANVESLSCVLIGTVEAANTPTTRGASRIENDTGVFRFGAVVVGSGASLTGEIVPGQQDGLLLGAPEGNGMASGAYWTASPFVGSALYAADATLELASWTGADGAQTGAAMASIGESCGHGTTTVVVGSPGIDTITLVSTPDALALEGALADTAIVSEMIGSESFGSALGAEGITDGAALVVGAPVANAAGYFVFVGEDDCLDPERAWREIPTPTDAAGFGASVAAGDMDGDGFSDMIISGDDDGAAALWLVNGACASEDGCAERLDLGELRGSIAALQVIDYCGKGDPPCSPDGYFDLVVGAPESGDDGQGQVMVLEGSSTGALAYNSAGMAVRTGEVAGDRFGASLMVESTKLLRDDTSSTSILIVGAPGVEVQGKNDALDDGVVYGWIGLESWCGTSSTLDPSFVLLGDEGTEFGAAIGKGHNLDGDPVDRPEVAVGAPGAAFDAGVVYIIPLFSY